MTIEMENYIDKKIISVHALAIEWERVWLHVDIIIKEYDYVSDSIPLNFYLVNGLYISKGSFKKEQLDQNRYRLSFNITNNGNCMCLQHGTYSIVACQGNFILAKCIISQELATNLDACSKNFLHSNNKKVYTVTFIVDEELDSLTLIMYVMDASIKGIPYFPNKRFVVKPRLKIKKNSFSFARLLKKNQKKLKANWKKSKKRQIINIYNFLSKRYKEKDKTIMFMSEQNEQLRQNQTAVYKRMQARKLDKEYKIFVSARKASSIEQSTLSWLILINKIAQCGKIFLDDHAPIFDWLQLHQETDLIQLWHAGAGFKASGYSRWGRKGCPGPKSCHRQYTFGIAGSKHIAPFFSEVFGINDEQILPTGMPRMDQFLDETYRTQKTNDLYTMFPICRGKQVILYAPTYRGKNRKKAYYPYDLIDFKQLYDYCKKEGYVVLFKMHPWVNTEIPIEPEYSDLFLDVAKYPNINDLFYLTDLLITDYSSNIYEYSLMEKPMLFFAFDKVQYSFSRGFHRAYEESAPGKVCYTFDDVLKALKCRDYEYSKVKEYIKNHFDNIDTLASDRVIDWILLGKFPKDIKQSIDLKKAEVQRTSLLSFASMQINEE